MRELYAGLAAGLVAFLMLALASAGVGSATTAYDDLPLATGQATVTPTPAFWVYLPLVEKAQAAAYTCPATSGNQYSSGVAFQQDTDNPVRPAYNHADKNLALRGYITNTDPGLKRELVNYGSDDHTRPPQFATLFSPNRVPALPGFYRVYAWNWQASPDPGTRGAPLAAYPVTALGLQTTPGESLHVPASDYDIGQGMEVMVMFADADSITLRYARQDSVTPNGYTLHIDNICTDPSLLALYNSLDVPTGPRYQYPNPSYNLSTLPAGQSFGTARGTEIVVAIVDSGSFMDPRSCNEWWQVRPGYAGACPAP